MLLRKLSIVVVFTLACREPPLPDTPPPTFVAPKAATTIGRAQIHLQQGENMVWSVTWRGQRVGTARLGVLGVAGALRVESRFRTVGLADQMHPVDHRLITKLTQSRQGMDDLHSALGRLRGWAATASAPATMKVHHGDQIYQVDFARPVVDQSLMKSALRIEGQARSGKHVIDMTLWLSSEPDHTPLQITLATDGNQVHATLLAPGSES